MRPSMDTSVQAPNLSKILRKDHTNKWVALSTNYKKLLAIGDTLAEVLKKTGSAEVAVMQVLPDIGYAPHSR